MLTPEEIETMKTLSQVFKTAEAMKAEGKPAAVSEKTTRLISEAELNLVAGRAGSVGNVGGGDCRN
jgi:hypothetical protein